MSRWPVERDPDFGCLLWTGPLDKDGYARTKSGRLAYHVVYRAEVGEIPEDCALDHVCRRRRCVFHLEPVTKAENERRKRWAYRLMLKRCPRGHELTPYTAMVTPEGGRVCRTCRDGY